MYADNFLGVNCSDYFLNCMAVGMTRGVNVYHVGEHVTKLLVLWVGLYLLRILVVPIP